jgi:NADPH-dependent curcumin reductase CurA
MNRQIISALVAVVIAGTIQANEQSKVTSENQEWLQGRVVSKKISYDTTMVNGFHEDLSFRNIDGGINAGEIEVKLNRSFRENLSEDVDKESIARMSQ